MSKFHEEVKNLFGIDNNNVMIDCETMSLAGNAAVRKVTYKAEASKPYRRYCVPY